MKRIICFIAVAVSLPLAANAEGLFKKKVAPAFCAPISELVSKLEECEGNDLLVAEGEKCLDKLEAESKAVSEQMGASFSDNLEEQQHSKFGSANQDFSVSSSALAYLIGTTKLARGEVEAYKWNLAWPADYDEAEVTNNNYKEYFMSVECYGTNRKNLDSLLADFDSRLKKFELAKAGAEAHALASAKRRGAIEVNSIDAQPLLKRGLASGGAPIPKNRFVKSDSTITGNIVKPQP